jgi:lysozyme
VIPDQIRKDLIADEKLVLTPYRDSVGKLTIGVGHNLDDNGVSTATAMFILDEDIARAVADLDRAFPWVVDLDDVRQRVLINMSFNLGISRLSQFKKMFAALELRQYTIAAVEMLDSTWAKQVGTRADRLAEMMRTGANPEEKINPT